MFIATLFTLLQDLEAAQVPMSRRVDRKAVVHLHHETLRSRKKEENCTLSDSMDGPGEYYVE